MTYVGQPHYPHWLDNLADDATFEGAAMSGTARGARAVHSIGSPPARCTTIRCSATPDRSVMTVSSRASPVHPATCTIDERNSAT
jgi:hypothetical protein